MAETAAGSRRPPTNRSASTSALSAASEVTSATSLACDASDPTAVMLGPMIGSVLAGDTNQLDSVSSAAVSERAASASCWAAVSSSASWAAARPPSIARAPSPRSRCTDTMPSAAPASINPSTPPAEQDAPAGTRLDPPAGVAVAGHEDRQRHGHHAAGPRGHGTRSARPAGGRSCPARPPRRPGPGCGCRVAPTRRPRRSPPRPAPGPGRRRRWPRRRPRAGTTSSAGDVAPKNARTATRPPLHERVGRVHARRGGRREHRAHDADRRDGHAEADRARPARGEEGTAEHQRHGRGQFTAWPAGGTHPLSRRRTPAPRPTECARRWPGPWSATSGRRSRGRAGWPPPTTGPTAR